MSNSGKCRGWVFTCNNPSIEDEHRCNDLSNHCTYIVFGRETAPTTGTLHLQGFVYFPNPRSFSGVRKLLPDGCHVEPKSPHSTFAQCVQYCKKDGNFIEHGTCPMDQKGKGDAGKLSAQERWAFAKAGDFEQLPPEHYSKYRSIHAEFKEVQDRDVLHNLWICGKSGCGKSRFVRDNYGGVDGTDFYSKGMNKWWDGYQHEETVLLDDFAPEHGKYLGYYLKIWADHYKFNAEVKGGMLRIRPKTLIVTSQYPIEACFEDHETITAVKRRFEVIQLAPFDLPDQYAPGFNHK